MKRIVIAHINRNGQRFRLSLVWNSYRKTYNYLELEWLGKYHTSSLNTYFLDCFAKKGNLMGQYLLEENIEKDLKEWLTKNKNVL